ncbi:MAG: response regulator, partial [Hylemonella sp.]|nr:response regulator [Hylemonella sp.]
ALRQEFIARMPARTAELESQLAAIVQGERQAVQELHRLAHNLVGTAGTHRLMVVCAAAREVEAAAAHLLETGEGPDETEMASLHACAQRLRDSMRDPLVSAEKSEPPEKSRTKQVWIVDDDAEHAQWLQSLLDAHGYEVEVFAQLEAFEQRCQSGVFPAAVIMDMVFPQGRNAGAEAIAELKKHSPYDLPVVFVSVRQDMASRLAAYRAGAARYLVKPVQPQLLLKILNESVPLRIENAFRVLLVDDDEEQLKVHAHWLRDEGMEVRECSNPLEVLYVLRDFAADALVLDLYMPQCSGYELAAIVRDEYSTQDIPIVYLSAETNVLLQYQALNRGGEHFLSKPVKSRELAMVVGMHARRYRENQRQQQILKAARYSQQRQQQALDAHAIVSITDVEGTINYVNRKFCEISGYGVDELLGRNHRFLKSNLHPQHMYEEMWRTIQDGRIWEGELCNQRNDGTRYWLKSTIVPFVDEQGKPYQYIAIRTDITDNKRAEEAMAEAKKQAEQASRSKSTFLAGMSHELRTPLNAMLGFSQLLMQESELSVRARDSAQEIEQAGQHLLWLVNDLIDLARIEAGTMVMSIEVIQVASVIEESLRMVEHMAHRYGVGQVSRRAPEAGMQIVADYVRLRQVVINLLSNAIKYNRPGGEVRIWAEAMGGHRCRILVSDSGQGIPYEKQGRVFAAFERLGEEHGQIEGVGIGLSITRRIVEAMGGAIGFESVPGRGSTFWVEFGQAKAGAVKLSEQGKAPQGAVVQDEVAVMMGNEPRSRVVYVEDNPMNQRLMQQIFTRRRDLELLEAATAEEGLELIRTQLPVLVLMDINLPGMNGFEAMKILKEDRKTAGIPVVAISANAMKGDAQKGLDAGFVAYLTKPLDISSLLSTVDKVLTATKNAPGDARGGAS